MFEIFSKRSSWLSAVQLVFVSLLFFGLFLGAQEARAGYCFTGTNCIIPDLGTSLPDEEECYEKIDTCEFKFGVSSIIPVLDCDWTGCRDVPGSKIDGYCGPASLGSSVREKPSVNLCDSGDPTSVNIENDYWKWFCNGRGGGENAVCLVGYDDSGGSDPCVSPNICLASAKCETEASSGSCTVAGEVCCQKPKEESGVACSYSSGGINYTNGECKSDCGAERSGESSDCSGGQKCCGGRITIDIGGGREEESGANYCPASYPKRVIVPCGRKCDIEGTPHQNEAKICTLCDLVVGVSNVIDYLLYILTFVAVTGLVIAGIMYIVSGANPSLAQSAKGYIWNILTGSLIVLTAWVMVNTTIAYVATKTDLGVGIEDYWTFYCMEEERISTGSYGYYGGGGGEVTCDGCTAGGYTNKSNEQVAIIQAGEHYKQSPCILGYSDYELGNKCCIGQESGKIQTGACGISQVIPYWHMSTCGYDGNNQNAADQKAMCKKLSIDKSFDSACGYAVIQDYSGNNNCQGIKNLALCYNGGPGHRSCGDRSSDGECYGDRVEAFYNECAGN